MNGMTDMTPMQQLLYRNAELETELRLVKEQLREAHAATQHLAINLSGQAAENTPTWHVRAQAQVDFALAEIESLKSRLISHHNGQEKGTSGASATKDSANATDLLDLADGDVIEDATSDTSTVAHKTAHRPSTPVTNEDLSRAKGLNPSHQIETATKQPTTKQSQPNSRGALPLEGYEDAAFLHSAVPALSHHDFVQSTASLNGIDCTSGDLYDRPRFHPSTRNAVAANAAYLEDQDQGQQMDTFFKLSKRFPEYVPFELKWLYENEVRPAFLAKQLAADEWRKNMKDECHGQMQDERNKTRDTGHENAATRKDSVMLEDQDRLSDDLVNITEAQPYSTHEAKRIDHRFVNSETVTEVSRTERTNDKNACLLDEDTPHLFQNNKLLGANMHGVDFLPDTTLIPSKVLNCTTSLNYAMPAQLQHTTSLLPRSATTKQSRHEPYRSPRNEHSRGPQEVEHLFFAPRGPTDKLRRTVTITNVPEGVPLADIVDHVHGGPLVSVTFLNTENFQTTPAMFGTNGAMIVFASASSAERFVRYCRAGYGLHFCTKKRPVAANVKARVQLLETPTWPSPTGMIQRMERRKMSRVLYVNENARRDPAEVARAIVQCSGNRAASDKVEYPLKAAKDQDGIIVLEYASAACAQRALSVLEQHDYLFKDAEFGYLPDPCDHLLNPTEHRIEVRGGKNGFEAEECGEEALIDGYGEDSGDMSTSSTKVTERDCGESMPRAVAAEVLDKTVLDTIGPRKQAVIAKA